MESTPPPQLIAPDPDIAENQGCRRGLLSYFSISSSGGSGSAKSRDDSERRDWLTAAAGEQLFRRLPQLFSGTSYSVLWYRVIAAAHDEFVAASFRPELSGPLPLFDLATPAASVGDSEDEKVDGSSNVAEQSCLRIQ